MTAPVLIALLLGAPVLAAEIDPRLATLTTAWVEPADPLADDLPIMTCFADHLARTTPLALAHSKADAPLVLRVSGHLYGDFARFSTGVFGTAKLQAIWPDGKVAWSGTEDVRTGKTLVQYQAADIPCALADALADKLRQAMKKARGKK